jgi:hypothetical protein
MLSLDELSISNASGPSHQLNRDPERSNLVHHVRFSVGNKIVSITKDSHRTPALYSEPAYMAGASKHGEGYVRFSYANALSNMVEAIARIGRAMVRWERLAAVPWA